MREITSEIVDAIILGKEFAKANTAITHRIREDNVVVTSVFLHGHLIAQNGTTGWRFNFCGYRTNVTRDRINAVRFAIGRPQVSLTDFKTKESLLTWFE